MTKNELKDFYERLCVSIHAIDYYTDETWRSGWKCIIDDFERFNKAVMQTEKDKEE